MACGLAVARDRPRRMVGIGRSGLQMILPLTPKFALMMHDSNVYNAASDRNIITLSSAAEVSGLNELQWLNAYQNVYFPPAFDQQSLDTLMRVVRPEGGLFEFRRLERVGNDNRYHPTDKDEFSPPSEGVKSELLLQSARPLPRDIRLRAVRLRERPVVYDDGSIASPQRDPAWEDIVSHFTREMRAGRASLGRFWEFVDRHPLSGEIGRWLKMAKRRSDRRRRAAA
ncbi:conserved hypothetical protein [Bosea sp. 62]|nr:conserved hypothetical protein [Bosea sp. 21B]CAD5295384.1 conserved hypothetical protein [Bosea sp. 46]CAD5298437.1 conserved hypothetical protein [Bosea sp. 7B]VVT60934.1 hypothetical protein BOS5A_230211 [Bosea sp. EC-HK365B]VXB35927.1 conserved hypothetical protein [Bosea sp. 127]VXB57911.1 conserved hypothetical protein [Bosea sp. 125]VXC76432.1 conserved hypothetical protein [Bosea sp. 29B]VXC90269.1 conserved hypothetical protein [Bosea sp. 62]